MTTTEDHFVFFGFDRMYHIDTEQLRKRFIENSRRYHPDFHTGADAAGQEEALILSTRNNEAYKILVDPVARLRYILHLEGLLGDESKNETLPQDFLMDMMELNEEIEEAAGDASESTIQALNTRIDTLSAAQEAAVQASLQAYDNGFRGPADLNAMREFYLKKQYLLRVAENIARFAGPR